MIVFIIIYVAVIIFLIAAMWKVFTKAGQPGWACIIPIYNGIVMAKIAEKPWWWGLLMLIPYVGIIWGIWVLNRMILRFGKSTGFTVGTIFLPFIFIPILGFGSASYTPQGNVSAA
ncbi:MAG: signal peptidase I [Flavobacteriales bacterium]|nr:signal peptidase I [Flavobacteriales bacterium]